VSHYQKGKTNLDFTDGRVSEWQWRQLGHMQVCTSLQTDNHASTPPLSFLQDGCPFCRPTNSVKALKACLTKIEWPELFVVSEVTAVACFLCSNFISCTRLIKQKTAAAGREFLMATTIRKECLSRISIGLLPL